MVMVVGVAKTEAILVSDSYSLGYQGIQKSQELINGKSLLNVGFAIDIGTL